MTNDIVVSDYGTRLTRTRIVRTSDHKYAWLVRNGPDHPERNSSCSIPALADIAVQQIGPTLLVLPQQENGWLRYETPGQIAAFYLVFADGEGAEDALHEAVWGAGRALARLHSTTGVVPSQSQPPGLRRLTRWFDHGGAGPGHASHLFEAMLRVVGDSRVRKLRAWIEEFEFGQEQGVLLHGGPSLGCLVPSPSRHRDHVLLTGEELCWGRAEFDLGWFLGELVELDMLERKGQMSLPPARLENVAHQLLKGYGRPVDSRLTGFASMLRVLTHAHDAASYHVWDETLFDHLALVSEIVDEEGIQGRLRH